MVIVSIAGANTQVVCSCGWSRGSCEKRVGEEVDFLAESWCDHLVGSAPGTTFAFSPDDSLSVSKDGELIEHEARWAFKVILSAQLFWVTPRTRQVKQGSFLVPFRLPWLTELVDKPNGRSTGLLASTYVAKRRSLTQSGGQP